MSAQVCQHPGPPALLALSGEPLALRWSGDPQLDAVLACDSAAEAARMLVGAERATRPVIRRLARSILGPEPLVEPGADANLFPMSVALGVDAPDGAMGRLAPDDIAAILAAGASPGASLRHMALGKVARTALRRVVSGYTRQRRRRLAIEILTDHSGLVDVFVQLLDEASDLSHFDGLDTPRTRLEGLVEHLERVFAPEPTAVLAGARSWCDHPPVDLPDGLQVRVPWNREQLESEAAAFDNCLGTCYRSVEVDGSLIATVRERGEPLAVAEISPSGQLRQLLGVGDADIHGEDHARVVGALRQAGVLP